MNKFLLKFMLLLSLILNSCGPAVLVPIPTPSSEPLTPAPLPTLQIQAVCPKAGNNVDLINPLTNVAGLGGRILNYLNQGGDPEKLARELTSPYKKGPLLQLTRMDLNNDGVDELAFSTGILTSGMNEGDGVDSALWIFQCRNGKYNSIYDDSYFSNPEIVAISDLNGDKQKEIIVQSEWHGSGCLEMFDAVEWPDNSTFHYLGNMGVLFPCGTKVTIGDSDRNGRKELIFQGLSDIRYDSIEGIQRGFIDTYSMNDRQVYTLISHQYHPSPYRVYALYDAQEALSVADFGLAVQLYDKAAHDGTLQDINSLSIIQNHPTSWIFGPRPRNLTTVDHPEEYLTAFALFRLVALYLRTGDQPKLASTLNELAINFPDGTFGSEFSDLANLLDQQFEAGKGFTLSCSAVASMIQKRYPLLEWHFDWSEWTIFYYTNETICPYSSDVNFLRIK